MVPVVSAFIFASHELDYWLAGWDEILSGKCNIKFKGSEYLKIEFKYSDPLNKSPDNGPEGFRFRLQANFVLAK